MDPFAIMPGTNFAYATGLHQGRDAIWKIDLTDEKSPELLFSHPTVDMGAPLFASDGRLLGARYDAERPGTYYTDPKAASAYAAIVKALPGQSVRIVDSTPDGRVFIARAGGDTKPPAYLSLEVTPEARSSR